jgi:twitching motility two-component system response regulator PilG
MAGEGQSCASATVLVVDDSKTVRQSASGFLAEQGYTVVTACDGFEALAKIVDCQPDLVFADIVMPRLDGYQTCALVKNNADYRHIPVIMLSSKDGLFDRARGRVVGADAHLSKPFSRDMLVATVEDYLVNDPEAAGMDCPVSTAIIDVIPG